MSGLTELVTLPDIACSETVSGTISGYTSSGLVLLYNGGNATAAPTGAATFTFASLPTDATYSVTIGTQPSGENCTVANGSGSFSGGAPSPVVTCVAAASAFTVGGTVSGYSGAGLVLQNNGADNDTIAPGATSFAFATELTANSTYQVTILVQPSNPAETCSIVNASGTVTAAAGNVTNVAVTCAPSSVAPAALNQPNGLAFNGNLLYVANYGDNNILIYSEQMDSAFSVTGLTLVGTITQGINSPSRLAFDSSGDLYVTNDAPNTGAITVYNPSNQEIVADKITQDVNRPLAIAVDDSTNPNIFVGNNASNELSVYLTGTSGIDGGFIEAAFSPLMHDGVTPAASANAFDAPGAMLFASIPVYGNFLLVGLGPTSGNDSILLYQLPFTNSSVPKYVLNNSNGCASPSGPTAIAFSLPEQQIYLANYYTNTIAVYSALSVTGATTTCPPPAMTISTGVSGPEGLAIDAHGNIFVSNSNANSSSITVYTPAGTLAYTQH